MVQNLNFMILDWIQEHLRCRALDWLMPKITILGEMGLLWIILAVVFLFRRSHRNCGITMLSGLLCSLLLGNVLLKNIVARERPCWLNTEIEMLIKIPTDYSFPSGHTLASFIAATILLHYDKRFGIPALLIASAIAFSRMYLYVHFPSDVIAGMVLGIVIGYSVTILLKKLLLKNAHRDANIEEELIS